VLSGSLGTVKIIYRAPRGTAGLSSDSFRATVDLSKYDMERAPEPQVLPIRVETLVDGVRVQTREPETVTVELDRIDEKSVPVEVDYGEVPELLEIDDPAVSVENVDVRGPAVVTAADLVGNPEVEILNQDLEIATLGAKGRLALDITVERGRGYVSADVNKTSATIGVIPMDSIFSPVRRVTFEVEPTRVEQSNDFDRLVIEVETDGSVSPREAMASAGGTLRSLATY